MAAVPESPRRPNPECSKATSCLLEMCVDKQFDVPTNSNGLWVKPLVPRSKKPLYRKLTTVVFLIPNKVTFFLITLSHIVFKHPPASFQRTAEIHHWPSFRDTSHCPLECARLRPRGPFGLAPSVHVSMVFPMVFTMFWPFFLWFRPFLLLF